MLEIKNEQLKCLTLNTQTNELTIEFYNKVDKTAISKITLIVNVKEIKQAESFTYL